MNDATVPVLSASMTSTSGRSPDTGHVRRSPGPQRLRTAARIETEVECCDHVAGYGEVDATLDASAANDGCWRYGHRAPSELRSLCPA